MYIITEVTGFDEICDMIITKPLRGDLQKAINILEKIEEASLEEKAAAQINKHFFGQYPDIDTVVEYIQTNLLKDMNLTEEDLNEIINDED